MNVRVTRRRGRGYTLIEVLFAIFIVLVCAMIVAATMPISNVSRSKSQDLQRAMSIAQKELEGIQGEGFSNTTAAQLATDGYIDSTTQVGANTYSCTNSDSANSDSPAQVLTNGTGTVQLTSVNLNLTQVVVTITWRDRVQYKSYSVGTLIANL